MAKRLLIVSNRLPVQFVEKKGKIAVQPSAGGLVSSIQSYLESEAENGYEVLWIGEPGITEKKFTANFNGNDLKNNGFTLHPVFLPDAVRDQYYNGFCNDTIWPLFHYFPSFVKFNDEYYENYKTANKLFAEKILRLLQPGDTLWIHDYHLMLLPSLIRKAIPEASIGFFLHIPFPSFEIFRLLPKPWRTDILEGLLGADLIGFHTYSYAQYFFKSVLQLLGYDHNMRTITTPERSLTVDTFPISIDYNKFNNAATTSILHEKNKIKKQFANMQIITSVDRLDYSKGIANRLEAFDFFLEKNPEFRGKVVYLLVVVPSRDIIPKYNENKTDIEILVSKINGKYGSIEWTPIIYQYRSLDFNKLAALYQAADIALITPLRDGMNLVAKEFVASKQDKRGVLILSETAGASSELSEALLVNPTDKNAINEALLKALQMPADEQIKRNENMQNRIRQYNVSKWASDFINEISESKRKHEWLKVKAINPNIQQRIQEKYSASEQRLILLDYDGTLTPLVKLPELAKPSPEIIELLTTLSEDPKNSVAIISGRNKDILQEWFGALNITLVAEHGGYYKLPNSEWEQTIPVRLDWKEAILPIMANFTDRCPGSFIENKEFCMAWHYRNAEKGLGFLRSRELAETLGDLSTNLDFQVLEGNKVVEAKAQGIDKGMAAIRMMDIYNPDFILAIGDDKTDENLFMSLPETAKSIKVGYVQSAARYNLAKQADVISFLKALVKHKPIMNGNTQMEERSTLY